MREIKFRVWFANRMAYNIPKILLHRGSVKEVHINWDEDDDTHNPADTWTDQNDYVLMQYTGFTHFGKDVYEGDIIENDTEWWKVVFDEGRFVCDPITEGSCWMDLGEFIGSRETNICGNIYENPELLGSRSTD